MGGKNTLKSGTSSLYIVDCGICMMFVGVIKTLLHNCLLKRDRVNSRVGSGHSCDHAPCNFDPLLNTRKCCFLYSVHVS